MWPNTFLYLTRLYLCTWSSGNILGSVVRWLGVRILVEFFFVFSPAVFFFVIVFCQLINYS